MSTSDKVVANDTFPNVRSDINGHLAAIASQQAGTADPSAMLAYERQARTDLGTIRRRNAANSGWIIDGTLAETYVSARSSNTILGTADHGRTINCTSSFTQTFTAVATLGDGWWCHIRNNGTGVIALDPNSTETIDGATVIYLAAGESCLVICNGSLFVTVGRTTPALLGKIISGLTYANNSGDATNDLDIAVGVAADSTGTAMLKLAAAVTKRLDASWVTGTNQGGLSSSLVIGNNDYYIHLIRVAGVDDIGFDTSATAANLVADHSATHYRLIGWFKRVGGTIVAFRTYETEGGGIEHNWDAPTLDVNLANTLTTSRRTDAVKVPLNFSVEANLNVIVGDASAGRYAIVYCPDQADLTPSGSAANLSNLYSGQAAVDACAMIRVRTSAAGLIAARASIATADLYAVSTIGFRWARRN